MKQRGGLRRSFASSAGLACAFVALSSGGTEGCNDRFVFDSLPNSAGAAGTLGQAGSSSAGTGSGGSSGSESTAGTDSIAGSFSGGGGSGGSMTGGTESGGSSSGTAGSGGVSDKCGAAPACPAPLHCADGICAECAADLDCAPYGLPRCEPIKHRCVSCMTSADCKSNFTCDVLAHRCAQNCTVDPDCGPGDHGCDQRRGVCYQCDENEECLTSTLGHLCASDGSGCVSCRSESDCPNQHCDQLRGRCVDCRDAHDCVSGLCDPTTAKCLTR